MQDINSLIQKMIDDAVAAAVEPLVKRIEVLENEIKTYKQDEVDSPSTDTVEEQKQPKENIPPVPKVIEKRITTKCLIQHGNVENALCRHFNSHVPREHVKKKSTVYIFQLPTTVEELASIKGISTKTAKEIVERLHKLGIKVVNGKWDESEMNEKYRENFYFQTLYKGVA